MKLWDKILGPRQSQEEWEDAALRDWAIRLSKICEDRGAAVMAQILEVWAGNASYPDKLREMLAIVERTL